MNKPILKTKIITCECKKHGEYTSKHFILEFPEAKSTEIGSSCPTCQREFELQQERLNKQNVFEDYKSMNIEPYFYESSFDNFNAYNNELKKHLETCSTFAEKPAEKLVMIGENGNGKTHLAISILKKVGGKIYTAFEIGLKLRQSYDSKNKPEWNFLEELSTVPLLVIDEVEKVKDSEAKQNWFTYVISKRHDRFLPIIFIANCHTKADCKEKVKPCSRCLEYHLENNILSRINENGTIMRFNSPDYREKIRADRL